MRPKLEVPFRPRRWQRPLINDPAPRIVAVVHRRAGKSTGLMWRGIRRCLTEKKPNPRVVHILPYGVMWKRTGLWDQLAQAARSIPGAQVWKSESRVEFANGANYQCGGADNQDSWRGGYADECIVDEYDDCPPSMVPLVIEPMLADRDGVLVRSGTPKGRGILQKAYDRAKVSPEYSSYLLDWTKTGALSQKAVDRLRQEMTEEEFAQELECFPSGSLVAVADDIRPIEELKPGDLVWTHTGRVRPVKSVMSRPYAGDLTVIEAYGSRSLRLTPEHPVYTYQPSGQSYAWKAAHTVTTDDWLVTPKKHNGLPLISAELAELVAWFVAEGSVTGNVVTFSLGAKETTFIERIQRCLTSLGREGKASTRNSVTTITCCDVGLADQLVTCCGSGARYKRLPLALLVGHEQLVFDTLINGDGCIHRTEGQGRHRLAYKYTTISEKLAQQVQMLASTIGLAGTYTVRPGGPAVIEGRTVETQTSYCVQLWQASNYDARDPNAKVRHGRHGVFGRVKSVGSEAYEGQVFNLSVAEDESYLVNTRAVHNCSFEAPNSGSYYGKMMNEAERSGRITDVPYDPALPVWTSWDLGIHDSTAVWFAQVTYGGEWRFIDYVEDSGMGLAHYTDQLQAKPYTRYAMHLLPHDAAVKELGSGMSRTETFSSLGLHPWRVLRQANVADGINAVRMVLPKAHFDAKNCERGINALRHYRREWNEAGQTWRSSPVHDWASHGADSMRYMALGVREMFPPKPEPDPGDSWERAWKSQQRAMEPAGWRVA